MELVGAIAEAPRKSLKRASLFADMRRELRSHWRDAVVLDWEQRMNDLESLLQRQRAIFDRELFYGLQSRERLERIIGQYRDALTS